MSLAATTAVTAVENKCITTPEFNKLTSENVLQD